jgi:hypothetical protein
MTIPLTIVKKVTQKTSVNVVVAIVKNDFYVRSIVSGSAMKPVFTAITF